MFRPLLVEDNVGVRLLIKAELQAVFPFIDAIEASDGREAFAHIDSSTPDLIFMDIGLPGENGLQLTRQIKNKHPDIIIVILTSHDSAYYRESAIRCRADHFLTKSCSIPDDVIPFVRSILLEKGYDADGSKK
jgi:DNA-binding NarL/FixJ family response regulator